MLEQWSDQLDLLIRAGTPLIWIRSAEEERVQNLLQQAVNRLGNRRLATWNFIDGLGGALNSDGLGARQPMAILQWLQELDTNNPTLLLLKDFHRFCDDPGIARMLRNLTTVLREQPHTLVLCTGAWSPPAELEESLTLLDLPLPREQEIHALLASIAQASGNPLESDVLEELTHACSGLTEARVRHVAARALAQRGALSREDLADVLEEKRRSLARSEVLEYCHTDADPADIGGLDALKHWLNQRHQAFSDEARHFGLPLPRGVLLVGPQGTGKSLTARAVAHSWSMPLLRLDVGRLFAGLVGASEARTRETICLLYTSPSPRDS